MIASTAYNRDIQEIRLKVDQLNEVLLCYIRSCLKEEFLRQNPKIKHHEILITRVTNLDFESLCLAKYEEMIDFFVSNTERHSTLEADQELLSFGQPGSNPHKAFVDLKLSTNQRFAVIYRSERKKILRSQLFLIAWMRSLLEQSYKVRSLLSVNAPRADVDRQFQQVYLSYMGHEAKQVNESGEFAEPEQEHWYFFRRLFVREYLQQVFQLHLDAAGNPE